jgi:hypothetical protein
MPWPWRRQLPPEVRSRLDLRPGERVLAHAQGWDHRLVATTLALHLSADEQAERVPWQDIERARWQEEGLVLTRNDGTEQTYPVEDPGRVPEVVHERVAASIAASNHVPLPGGNGHGVRITARRTPGEAAVRWHLRFDPGLDPDDPDVRRHAQAALADLRQQTGL